MTSPFEYSISSSVVSNVENNNDESENDFRDAIEPYENFDEDYSSFDIDEFYPDTFQNEFEDAEADLEVLALNDDSYLYESPQESENSITIDSDDEVDDQDSADQESKKDEVDQANDGTVEDYQECPICLSAWTNAGKHRLCSLRCGHLFGYECIKQWLTGSRSSKKCPQCKAKASVKNIRFIYANKLTSVDNSELEAMKKRIDESKSKLLKVSKALSKAKQKAKKYKRLFKRLRVLRRY